MNKTRANRIPGIVLQLCLFTGLTSSGLAAQEQFIPVPVENNATGLAPSEENCSFYKKNESWLPDAFIVNATCACKMTPDELKANIIRKHIQEQVDAIPAEIKAKSEQNKQDLANGKIRKHSYNRFVKKELSTRIYKAHITAYDVAGCEGNPPKKWAWRLVSTREINNCKTIWFSIRCLGGSCSSCFCKW